MDSLKNNILFKVGMIVLTALVLLIPQAMISRLIDERAANQEAALSEISDKWGHEQLISGPYVTIPYYHYAEEEVMDGNKRLTRTVRHKRYLHFLPTELNISSVLEPEIRYRNIYEVVVYKSNIKLEGVFDAIQPITEFHIQEKDILFNEAFLSVGISDLSGIKQQVALQWNNEDYKFSPGIASVGFISNGISTPISISREGNKIYQFSLDLELNGSSRLQFVPAGQTTHLTMASTWNTPSFNGSFLPENHNITDTGFTAQWNILDLNRNFPQSWTGTDYSPNESFFGIDLLLPVDNYQKTSRAIKYAILFIAMTFMVFFFTEVFKQVYIHPIQYLLVGLALIVFYTLLLSISEYMTFNGAFLISALATLLLISGYVKAILKSNALVGIISGILLILYLFIFIIIQLESYAFLFGSIFIFIILATMMYLSRKIDWYNIKLGSSEDSDDLLND